tara:strand:- start:332 stop:682 length:351 start_codon:yes stop_codon:yes gene_type:complete
MVEAIGYLGAIVTFAGFLTNNLTRIRLCSLLACAIWITYGVLINSGSVLLCNVTIAALQVFKLVQERKIQRVVYLEELISLRNEIEQEMRFSLDVSLDWKLDQVEEKINKLSKGLS